MIARERQEVGGMRGVTCRLRAERRPAAGRPGVERGGPHLRPAPAHGWSGRARLHSSGRFGCTFSVIAARARIASPGESRTGMSTP
jgi:hypothetical protein